MVAAETLAEIHDAWSVSSWVPVMIRTSS